MNVLFQEIKQSILNLVGAGIEALPRILVAIAFSMFTSWAAKFARKPATRVTDMTIKNQSLRSLLIQLSSVAAWVVGILISSAIAFGDSSIDLKVRYWTIPNQREVCRIQTRVMLALKNACDGAEINIPYPIRTVYHYNQEYFNDTYPQVSNPTSLPSNQYDPNRR
ncbi:MAG: mechanosensitive ion channel family protein [Roseofilum sp. Belize BBD 4]|uniref:mechanosensitive ion channel family protein n=1 Tax=Roseofilum sp. Belize BBD 4 TaxID=2821500 RepID=UPI000E8A1BB3|nr:mechanosensitive ion channel family protein [Roseofilum sp. Belize BBD 4]MBP0034767.1 mechanosensitive ion channel family protein [Roseofilum sp. Belize BBD 4]HBQ98662.1 hypothetical protein [Cyanobacteria bacterium UBA11691]